MSSPPDKLDLESLIADNWHESAVRIALPFLEEYRDAIEDIARDYDEETQSWRDYRSAVWSAVPDSVFDAIDDAIDAAIRVSE